jgi:hypothetical protein
MTDLQDRAAEGGALTCVVWKHGATLPSRTHTPWSTIGAAAEEPFPEDRSAV